MPRKVFVAGEILTAADVNTNLMDQAVMSFAGTAARGSAIPSPVEGMVAYLEDQDLVTVYDGSAWKNPLATTGGILQVVSVNKTDAFSTTSSSYTNVTGLAATITPRFASYKVFVLVQIAHGAFNNTTAGTFKVTGGNAASYVGDAAGSRTRGVFGGGAGASTSNYTFSSSIAFFDSPATTSATTYQVEVIAPTSETATVNRSLLDSDGVGATRGASSITLLEVAG